MERVRQFRDERDWQQFHTPKNLMMALAAEVGELLAEGQWLGDAELLEAAAGSAARDRITDEIADVTIYLIRLADVMGVNILEAAARKLAANDIRFPVSEVRGRTTRGRAL